MRCICCNKNLSDKESTRRAVNTGEYLDMCNGCFASVANSFPSVEGRERSGDIQVEEELS